MSARRPADARWLLEALLDRLPGFAWRIARERSGCYILEAIGRGCRRVLGYGPEALLALRGWPAEALEPGDAAAWRLALERSAELLAPLEVEIGLRHADGGRRRLRWLGRPQRTERGPSWVGVAFDVGDRGQAPGPGGDHGGRSAAASLEGLLVHDRGRIVGADDGLARLLGCRAGDLIGGNARRLLAPDHRRTALDHLLRQPELPLETEGVRRDGLRVPVQIVARDLDHGGRRLGVVAVRELDGRRRATGTPGRLAFLDPLTGLPNRTLLHHRLGQVLARARHGCGALLLLDLCCFKAVNETRGYRAGDRLLAAVGERLARALPRIALVGRLGADEFAVVDERARGDPEVEALAERVLRALEEPFVVEGERLHVATRVGVARFPEGGRSAEEVLRRADLALARAKSREGARIVFFTPEMERRVERRRALEDDLRAALAGDGFRLYYQPQVELASRRVVGAEALLRFPRPGGGAVPPAELIPVAEASGLILPIGSWVLASACRQAEAWAEAGFPGLRVAINVSAAQFHGQDLAGLVASVLEPGRKRAFTLELELTESVLLDDDLPAVTRILARLEALGVGLAIDDFGVGYSSLRYLRRLPFTRLKIDRFFIAELGTGADAAAVVEAIVSLGHSLGMRVLAEGVENDEQLAFLREAGCDEAQGYLIGEPRPAEAFLELLCGCRPVRRALAARA